MNVRSIELPCLSELPGADTTSVEHLEECRALITTAWQPSLRVSFDWDRIPLKHQLTFGLGLSRHYLLFGGGQERQPHCKPHSQAEFIEGLWDSDVIELFCDHSQGGYVELNLSPKGAWWAQRFVEYRRRHVEDYSKQPVFSFSLHNQASRQSSSEKLERAGLGGWGVVGCFPLSMFGSNAYEGLCQGKLGVNVCGIFGGDTRSFVSANLPAEAGSTPDFHRDDLRQPVEVACGR